MPIDVLAPDGLILASSESDLGVALAAVIVFGVGAQWLGSRLRIPSILLLLLGGILAGPVLEIVDPDELLGDLLFPGVSLAVGILLFEGGLGLRVAELERHGRGPIIRLITLGVLVTWVLGGIAAYVFLDVDRGGAVLIAAILTVSGPTVVLPLLRFARVREPVNGILRWEGIFIDPIGATLAIVVLDAVLENEGAAGSAQRILTTAGVGTGAGLLAAALLTIMVSRHWVPDHLHNPFTLALVVAAFASADYLQAEAGLFATTVMGVALANQRRAPIAHIREFEENLGALILAGLFIVLGARIEPDQLTDHLPGALALSAVLILVARPAAVYLSTVGSGLSFVERAYLVCMSPRGIVAASVSAVFGLELEEAGAPIPALVPAIFIVIVVTDVFSSIASRVGAKRFRVARPDPRGVAFIGGPEWVVELAAELGAHDIPTLIITTDPLEAAEASANGVLTYTGKLDSDDLLLAMDSVGIKSLIGVSRFGELNALVIDRAAESVGRANLYYLPRTDDDDETEASHATVIARRPFDRRASQIDIERLAAGGSIVAVADADFDPDGFSDALALLDLEDEGPVVLTSRQDKAPEDGIVRLYLRPDPGRQGSEGSSEP